MPDASGCKYAALSPTTAYRQGCRCERCVEKHAAYYRQNKDACKQNHRRYVEENRTFVTEYKKQWYEDNKEAVKTRVTKNYRKRTPEARLATRLKRYGLSVEQYKRKADEQGNKCAICSGQQLRNHHLAVDHDHKTGQIRGLLCYKCNFGIGLFNDNITLMEKTISYLRRNQ